MFNTIVSMFELVASSCVSWYHSIMEKSHMVGLVMSMLFIFFLVRTVLAPFFGRSISLGGSDEAGTISAGSSDSSNKNSTYKPNFDLTKNR